VHEFVITIYRLYLVILCENVRKNRSLYITRIIAPFLKLDNVRLVINKAIGLLKEEGVILFFPYDPPLPGYNYTFCEYNELLRYVLTSSRYDQRSITTLAFGRGRLIYINLFSIQCHNN
jgi:hypothetical protein